MKLLLNDKFAPITSEIGFLECSVETAAKAFSRWQESIHLQRGVVINTKKINGDLQNLLQSLLPLTSVERRRTLFMPTNSQWTAYFDNGWQGGDPASVVSYLCEVIGCQGIRAVSVPHTLNEDSGVNSGRYGSVILEVYSPYKTDFINTKRSIFASFDGGRWLFQANGEQQEFENVNYYKRNKIKDRFTSEILQEYLHKIGIEAFSEEFYKTNKPSYLIYKEGISVANMKEYSLQEAQKNF